MIASTSPVAYSLLNTYFNTLLTVNLNFVNTYDLNFFSTVQMFSRAINSVSAFDPTLHYPI